MVFGVKISKYLAAQALRILLYLLFLEDKRVWSGSLPFFWKIH